MSFEFNPLLKHLLEKKDQGGIANFLGVSASNPAGASQGDYYYNSTTNEYVYYTGTKWLAIDSKDYKFYVPDPFAWGAETHPDEIKPFQEFNLAMVKGSARNVNSGFDKKAAIKLGTNLGTIGVRPKTLSSIAKQLVDEKINSWKVVRRRSFQSIMAFDVFLKQLKKHKPQFSTFFSNHVAATMHRYWAATFPEDYDEYLLSDEWKNKYSSEIDYAMNKFDGFLKDLIDFVNKNQEYKLIVASSMGQESTLAMEQKSELLAKDFNKFLNKLGFNNDNY